MPVETIALPSAERLHEIFEYHAETGLLLWRINSGRKGKIGEVAGFIAKASGYRRIRVDGQLYQAHRLVWVMHYGPIPSGMFIDHSNGRKDDNRLCNLRLATNSENQRNRKVRSNNASGLKGVSWRMRSNKFIAKIHHDGKEIYLGFFPTAELAHSAYCKAAERYHGEFARVA